jgi:protein SCO1/2
MKRSAMPWNMPPVLSPFASSQALPANRENRVFTALLTAGWLIAGSLCLAACNSSADRPEAPLAGSQLGGDFTLTDKAGKTVRYADFAGKWRILYFGYTFCPDVCPLDVQHLMQGYHAFARQHPELAARTVPMFISIDPGRDTPQAVGQFAAAFGRELVGLTGTPAQVAVAAKAFAVYYQKRPGTNGNYLMDHSRAAYLMDPDGKPVALLPADENGPAVAAELDKWVH